MRLEPPAPIPSSAYTDAYYRFQNRGGSMFLETGGLLLPPKCYVLLGFADLHPGLRVLDVGCGRGELALNAALAGADTTGVDYSAAALALAAEAAAALGRGVDPRPRFVRCDAKSLPFPDASFDRILSTEVAEHLHPWELDRCYAECARVLAPGGHLVVHTVPNRLRYTAYYPLRNAAARVLGRRRPTADRDPLEDHFHVNELSPLGMWRSLRRHFWVRVFVRSPRDFFLRDLRTAARRAHPLHLLRCKNLWAVGVPRGPDERERLRAVLRRAVTLPRSALEMGTGELPHLGRGWSQPLWAPPVVRRLKGVAAARLATGPGLGALEVEYLYLEGHADPGSLEIRVEGRSLGTQRTRAPGGGLRVPVPTELLERASVRVELLSRSPLGVRRLALV